MTSADGYLVVDIATWAPSHDEQMGTKYKMWVDDPNGGRWLFKGVRSDERMKDDYGDDWAEKVSTSTATALEVPVAAVELAQATVGRGTISRAMNDGRVVELVHGNELLAATDVGYDASRRIRLPKEKVGYTVAAMQAALAGIGPPTAWDGPPHASAFDVLAGYLMLDAVIANTDRHDENWGVLAPVDGGGRTLAPSFDHGSSLGFNISDDEARDLASSPERLKAFARRGRCRHVEGKPRLVDLALDALAKCDPQVRQYWLSRLDGLSVGTVASIVGAVPDARMSDGHRTFVQELIKMNRGRVLDAGE